MSVFTGGPYGRLAIMLNTLSSLNIEIIIIIILGPAFFQMNILRLLIIQKNWFNYTGFVQKLDNIRIQDGAYFDEVSSSSGCLGWVTLFYCGTP